MFLASKSALKMNNDMLKKRTFWPIQKVKKKKEKLRISKNFRS